MTITITELATGDATNVRTIRELASSGLRIVFLKVTFDNSYPTGGESLGLANYGLTPANVAFFGCEQVSNRICTYDRTNDKLLLYTALSTEAANASNQSSITVYVSFWGLEPG